MKRLSLIVTLAGLFGLGAYQARATTPQDTGTTAKPDVKEAGHIPGAKHLYWRDLVRSEDIPELRPASELLDRFQAAGAVPGKEIITYCRTGMQSSLDYFIAKYLGYSVRMYVGSFYDWSHSDRAVETSPSVH